MKKLLLIASSVLLLSCTTNEELETSVNPESISKEITSKNARPVGAVLLGGENITLKCNGSSNFQNPINLNPNYPYVTSHEVLYQDMAPMWGRNQIRLSEFVALNLFGYGGGPFVSLTEVYLGSGSLSSFNSSPSNFSYIQDYTIGQDGDNMQIYGEMFPYNTSMSLDAANTVLHGFKAQIDQLTSQGKQIVAVHLYTDALLCVPSFRFIKMTVKVL